jgi:hypothetical protein
MAQRPEHAPGEAAPAAGIYEEQKCNGAGRLGEMTTYRISRLHVGEAVSWLMIATLPDRSQRWLGEYPTGAEGQSVADRLNADEEALHGDYR